MPHRVKFRFISPGQFFNLTQSNQNKVLIINLLKQNPFEDLGIPTVNLYQHLKKLTTTDPVTIKTTEDFISFMNEAPDILENVMEYIDDKTIKQKRYYVCILTNESRLPRYMLKVFRENFNDLFDCIDELKFTEIRDKFEKVGDGLWKYVKKVYKLCRQGQEEAGSEHSIFENLDLKLKKFVSLQDQVEDNDDLNDDYKGELQDTFEVVDIKPENNPQKRRCTLQVNPDLKSVIEKSKIDQFDIKVEKKEIKELSMSDGDIITSTKLTKDDDKIKALNSLLQLDEEKGSVDSDEGSDEGSDEIQIKSKHIPIKENENLVLTQICENENLVLTPTSINDDNNKNKSFIRQNTCNSLPKSTKLVAIDSFSPDMNNNRMQKRGSSWSSQVNTINDSKISLSNAHDSNDFMQLALNEIRGLFIGLKINYALALQKHRETFLLRDGTTNFLERYPYILKSHSFNLLTQIKGEWGIPNEIIPGQIWLGNCHHAESKQIISGMGITHVLNLTKEIDNCFESEVKYLKIPVNDYTSSCISIYFKDCWDFLEGHRFGRVLVHCVLGRSRSCSMLVMYLMKKFRQTYCEANDLLSERRMQSQINLGFEAQLQEFERKGYEFDNEEEVEKKKRQVIEDKNLEMNLEKQNDESF